MDQRNLRHNCERGELVRMLYRLGRQHASGVLTIRVLPAVGSADPVPRPPVLPRDDSGGTRDAFGRVRDESGRVAQGTTYVGRNPLLAREESAPRGNTFIGRNPLLGREIPGFPSSSDVSGVRAMPPPPPGSPDRAGYMRARTSPPPIPPARGSQPNPRERQSIPTLRADRRELEVDNGVVDRREGDRRSAGRVGERQDSAPSTRGEVFVLRRGAVVMADGELAKRTMISRLVRLASVERCHITFEGGVNMSPPGATSSISLAVWARAHLEAQLDNTLAERLQRQLAGMRMSIRPELAPDDALCDEADKRILAAMAQPRRLDQIWPLSRTPRFRMLSFLWFLRAIDALVVEGVVAERSAPQKAPPRAIDPHREAAARTLGLAEDADLEAIKRAYRRLARTLHPDMQPEVSIERRRMLETRFAEVTAAYESLI
ncbi:MAG: J domain-containing protein [Kofleriaceae bacterium]